MAIPGNVGAKKSTFSSPAAMAQAQRAAEAQSMKALQDRREKTRQEFFKGREDISNQRLDKRQIQKDLYEQFKANNTKLVPGTTNLYQDTTLRFDTNPMSPTFGQYTRTTLADKATELAMKYGPTGREIMSDMGYAIGSMAKGAGDILKQGGIGPLSILKQVYDKFKGGTQQGIETVGGLYDNLRNAFKGKSQFVSPQAMGSIPTQEELAMLPFLSQPGSGYQAGEGMQVGPVTEIKSKQPIPDQFRNIGDESDTSIFGIDNAGVPLPYERSIIENPLYNQQVYKPFRVSDMDITGLTAQNLIDPTRVGQTVSDYYDAALQGVDINTPIGKLNLNPMAQKVFLDGRMGNLNYGGSFDPDTYDYNVGIGTQLPYGVGLSLGASSNDIPGMSFNKYIGPVNTSLNLSEQGGSVGLNTIVDPLRAVYPSSAIGVPINVGASVDSTGRITPNIGLAVPFKDGGSVDKYAGLGYKLK